MSDNTREYLSNAKNLTGHLQKSMMERNQERERWLEKQLIRRRIEELARKSSLRKTASGRASVKKEAYAYLRKNVRTENERRKYRKEFNEGAAAFSRPIDQRCLGQGQNPYGVVPIWMNDRYGPSRAITSEELKKLEDDVNIF